MDRQTHITTLMQSASSGDSEAAEDLLPLVYDELRSLAEARLKRIPPGQTLQATALVHEAYMRMIGTTDPGWSHRAHFFFAAARAMRDILVESARAKATQKRGGDRKRLALDLADAFSAPADDLLALTESLDELERLYPRKHKVVELRFFAGLTQAEIAMALDVSERTVSDDWRFARTWLYKQIGEADGELDRSDAS